MMESKLAVVALWCVVAVLAPGTLEQNPDDVVRKAEETLQETPGGSYPYAVDVVIARHTDLEEPTVTAGPDCNHAVAVTSSFVHVIVACWAPPSSGIQWQCSTPRLTAEAPLDVLPAGADLHAAAYCADRGDGSDRGTSIEIDGPGEGASVHRGTGHAFPFMCRATFRLETLGVVHCEAGP